MARWHDRAIKGSPPRVVRDPMRARLEGPPRPAGPVGADRCGAPPGHRPSVRVPRGRKNALDAWKTNASDSTVQVGTCLRPTVSCAESSPRLVAISTNYKVDQNAPLRTRPLESPKPRRRPHRSREMRQTAHCPFDGKSAGSAEGQAAPRSARRAAIRRRGDIRCQRSDRPGRGSIRRPGAPGDARAAGGPCDRVEKMQDRRTFSCASGGRAQDARVRDDGTTDRRPAGRIGPHRMCPLRHPAVRTRPREADSSWAAGPAEGELNGRKVDGPPDVEVADRHAPRDQVRDDQEGERGDPRRDREARVQARRRRASRSRASASS